MTIYSPNPSGLILPYTYKGVHRLTGAIYIGSRYTKHQVLPAELDLLKYKTSSSIIRPAFEEYDWEILEEFHGENRWDDAYDSEQYLIYQQWQIDKSLSMNGVCYHKTKRFRRIGPHTNETIEKIQFTKNKIGEDGLTVNQRSALKSSESRRTVGPNGEPSIFELVGKKMSGENHPNTKTINIYDNLGKLMYTSTGAFPKFCAENGLPYRALYKSIRADGKPIYDTNNAATLGFLQNNGNIKFKGWYAVS